MHAHVILAVRIDWVLISWVSNGQYIELYSKSKRLSCAVYIPPKHGIHVNIRCELGALIDSGARVAEVHKIDRFVWRRPQMANTSGHSFILFYPSMLVELSVRSSPSDKTEMLRILMCDWCSINSWTSLADLRWPCSLTVFDLAHWLSLTLLTDLRWSRSLTFVDLAQWPSLTSLTDHRWPCSLTVFDLAHWLSLTLLTDLRWPRSLTFVDLAQWPSLTSLTDFRWPRSLTFVDLVTDLSLPHWPPVAAKMGHSSRGHQFRYIDFYS